MESNIIVDSCVDFNEDVFASTYQMERIPFKINIDDEEIIDKNSDTDSLLSKMKARTNKILTACPSPNDFITAYQKYKNNFVITISSKLSGCYNSAIVAKDIIMDSGNDTFIHVFDSKSASAGESLVALKVTQLIQKKLSSSQIIEETNRYIANMKTFFILESLENLIKNGRISHLKGIIGSVLHIVPIMGDDGNGKIELKAQARGEKKAIDKLIQMIGESKIDFANTILGITHVNAKEKAQSLKEEILKIYAFKDVLIFHSGGLSTVYADDGGIVIAY